jgi:hypothetical protein
MRSLHLREVYLLRKYLGDRGAAYDWAHLQVLILIFMDMQQRLEAEWVLNKPVRRIREHRGRSRNEVRREHQTGVLRNHRR